MKSLHIEMFNSCFFFNLLIKLENPLFVLNYSNN